MPRKRFIPEQVITKLREAEVELARTVQTASPTSFSGVLGMTAGAVPSPGECHRSDIIPE